MSCPYHHMADVPIMLTPCPYDPTTGTNPFAAAKDAPREVRESLSIYKCALLYLSLNL